jgi:hypothetical protein
MPYPGHGSVPLIPRTLSMIISTLLRDHTRTLLGALVLVAVPFSLHAADVNTSSPAPVINTVCPMDGKPIDGIHGKMVMMTIGEGTETKPYRMACCSEVCSTAFMKDPGAALESGMAGPKGGDVRRGK